MSEIIDFEEARRRLRPQRSIVLALDDALFDALGRCPDPPTVVDGSPVSYMRASEAATPPPLVPELGLHRPSAVRRRELFQCVDGCLYEQDDAALVYLGGEPIWPQPPVSFGVPRERLVNRLLVGAQGALLLAERVPGGWRLRIRVTATLARVVRLPAVTRPEFPNDWLAAVGGLLEGSAAGAE